MPPKRISAPHRGSVRKGSSANDAPGVTVHDFFSQVKKNEMGNLKPSEPRKKAKLGNDSIAQNDELGQVLALFRPQSSEEASSVSAATALPAEKEAKSADAAVAAATTKGGKVRLVCQQELDRRQKIAEATAAAAEGLAPITLKMPSKRQSQLLIGKKRSQPEGEEEKEKGQQQQSSSEEEEEASSAAAASGEEEGAASSKGEGEGEILLAKDADDIDTSSPHKTAKDDDDDERKQEEEEVAQISQNLTQPRANLLSNISAIVDKTTSETAKSAAASSAEKDQTTTTSSSASSSSSSTTPPPSPTEVTATTAASKATTTVDEIQPTTTTTSSETTTVVEKTTTSSSAAAAATKPSPLNAKVTTISPTSVAKTPAAAAAPPPPIIKQYGIMSRNGTGTVLPATSTMMPRKYAELESLFASLDSIVRFHRQHRSGAADLEITCNEATALANCRLTKDHIRQMQYVSSRGKGNQEGAYRFPTKGEKTLIDFNEDCPAFGKWENEGPLGLGAYTENRKKIFHGLLVEMVGEHHEKFLQGLPENQRVLKYPFWHPKFPIDNVPAIPLIPLPSDPTPKTRQGVMNELETAQANAKSKALQVALAKAIAIEGQRSKTFVKPDNSNKAESSPSGVLLANLAPKERDRVLAERKATTAVDGRLLSDVYRGLSVETIQKVWKKEKEITERKAEMARTKRCLLLKHGMVLLETIAAKFLTSGRSGQKREELVNELIERESKPIARDEVESQLDLLLEVGPEWIKSVTANAGVAIIRVDKTVNVNGIKDRMKNEYARIKEESNNAASSSNINNDNSTATTAAAAAAAIGN